MLSQCVTLSVELGIRERLLGPLDRESVGSFLSASAQQIVNEERQLQPQETRDDIPLDL